ncbi:hypothetical protein PQZ37_00760 [bacterium]|jgi:hypothetical protein|nr:hypothetical protein [bacterium]
MPFPTTGSNTELQAVNQILASVGQAPVTTLTTEETLVINETARFTGSIAGTTLTTTTANIPIGTYIGGTGVTTGTSIAVAGVEASPATSPVTYEYTVNISQTVSNRALTQSSVTSRVENQTNPDVAIALNTLREVSREVQSEGWSFNKELDYPITPDSNNEVNIANNVLQMDLNRTYTQNIDRESINRGGKLYDKKKHSNKWTDETLYVDIIWYFDWKDIPDPIQAFIVARAASIVSSRIIGDGNQYQMLQQKEAFTRATAMEYECNQEDFSFFGAPKSGNYYQPYQPFHTLQR